MADSSLKKTKQQTNYKPYKKTSLQLKNCLTPKDN